MVHGAYKTVITIDCNNNCRRVFFDMIINGIVELFMMRDVCRQGIQGLLKF